MKTKINLFALIAAFLALSLNSCNDDPDPTNNDPEVLQFTFSNSDGIYFGKTKSSDAALYRLNLRFGEFDNNGGAIGETAVLTLDCYAAESADNDNAILPAAKYNVASGLTTALGEIAKSSSTATWTDENGKKMTADISSGNMTVMHNGEVYSITVDFTTNTGTVLKGTYSGTVIFENKVDLEEEEDEFSVESFYFGNNLLTFTGGFTIDIYYTEDIGGVPTKIGTQIMAYMPIADDINNVTLKAGSYTVGNSKAGLENTFEIGNFDNLIGIRGTYSYIEQNGEFYPQKFVTGGSLEIVDNGSNEYTIIADFTAEDFETGAVVDNITFEYKGKIEFEVSATEYYDLDTMTANYYGDELGTGAGYFKGDVFSYASTHRFGLKLQGFMNLISDLSNIEFESGTYTVASTGSAKTLIPGKPEGTTLTNTYFYYYDDTGLLIEKAVIITGGTMTVTKQGSGSYRILTDFTGIDPLNNNRPVKGIKFEYNGSFELQNKIPGEPEFYGLGFNLAKFKHVETSDGMTNLIINFYKTDDETYTYTLGVDLYVDAIDDVTNITIPAGTYEPSTGFDANTFFAGYHNEETNKYHGTCMFKMNKQTFETEFIVITGGTLTIMSLGDDYMLMPYLEGTNIKTNSPASIGGSFSGPITQVDDF